MGGLKFVAATGRWTGGGGESWGLQTVEGHLGAGRELLQRNGPPSSTGWGQVQFFQAQPRQRRYQAVYSPVSSPSTEGPGN